jgi:hypothetical protein
MEMLLEKPPLLVAQAHHRPLYWLNGNKLTISIGLKEELRLFTLSSFITAENVEIKKKFLIYKETEILYEAMDSNNEMIITMQVCQGGSAPPKPYKTTIKQILDTMSCS